MNTIARKTHALGLAALCLALVACIEPPAQGTSGWLWKTSFGGPKNDLINAVTANASGAWFAVGATDGGLLAAETPSDGFVVQFTPDGQVRWVRTHGSNGHETLRDAASTNLGGVVAVGSTNGPDGTSRTDLDALILTYGPDGEALPALRFGSDRNDEALGVALDPAGNALVVGYTDGALEGNDAHPGTRDGFVAKFRPDVSLGWVRLWVRSLGCPDDCEAQGVALGANAAFVTGFSFGDLPGGAVQGVSDALVARIETDGGLAWLKPFGGAGSDVANAIAVGPSNEIYLAGHTDAALAGNAPAGREDAFVARLEPDGQVRWVRLLGSGAPDVAVDALADHDGVLIAGYTEGDLGGQHNAGGADAFLARFSGEGTVGVVHLLGTSGADYANGLAVNAQGAVLIGGYNDMPFTGSQGNGFTDGFVARFGPP